MWLKMGNRKVIIIHDNTGWHVTTLLIDVNWTEEIVGMSNLEPNFHKAIEKVLGAKVEKDWKYPWATLGLIWLSPIYFMAAMYEFMLPIYKHSVLLSRNTELSLGWWGIALGLVCLVLTTRTLNQLWKRLF